MIPGKIFFIKHLESIKQKAGARYTPELNVDLPISEIFDGISRTERFYTTIRTKYGELSREFKHISSKYEDNELQNNYNKIKKIIDPIFKHLEGIKEYNTSSIPWSKIQQKIKTLNDNLWNFVSQLRKAKEKAENKKMSTQKDGKYQASPAEILGFDIHHVYKTQEIVRYFEELSSSQKAKLSNCPFLLITGSAGTGKTHYNTRIKLDQDFTKR